MANLLFFFECSALFLRLKETLPVLLIPSIGAASHFFVIFRGADILHTLIILVAAGSPPTYLTDFARNNAKCRALVRIFHIVSP